MEHDGIVIKGRNYFKKMWLKNTYIYMFVSLCVIACLLIAYQYVRRHPQPGQVQQQQNHPEREPCDWTDVEGEPFRANPGDIETGETELAQYTKYRQMKQNAAGGSSDQYTYRVTLLGKTKPPPLDGIFILVEERFRGKATSGGSSLTAYAEHLSRDLCNYRDMFNGSYIVWCPPMKLGGRRDFIMNLQYVNFGAYAGNRVALNQHIWHYQIKLSYRKRYTRKYLNRPDVTTALGARMNGKNTVIWYQKKERWRVKLANGAHFFSLSTKRMCACVRSMNHLIMVGSSHMRYKFNYVVETCYNPHGNFPSAARYKNMIFIRLKYAEDVLKKIFSVIGNMTFTETDMLFVQSGAWNLATRGLDQFMDSSLKIYADALVFLRAKIGISRSNFVVVTQPPFAIHETVRYSSGNRNNYCNAAAVRQLKSLLHPHAFNIFDEFAILQPQSEDSICAVHYICPVFDGRNFSVYGDVGIASAKLMIAHSCRGHATLVKPCTRQ
ncbi:hypothetical protein NP493_759g01030 [Ridgeia piscesae]|uniref:Uncharacterized protein n=1 Tax=Ridgeia piscesae TaxID=27915 RepID=A0AAD9NNI6_RIDPI|nr:hypothetical protein NP493_759g01030 [Ridgeia piscesae]